MIVIKLNLALLARVIFAYASSSFRIIVLPFIFVFKLAGTGARLHVEAFVPDLLVLVVFAPLLGAVALLFVAFAFLILGVYPTDKAQYVALNLLVFFLLPRLVVLKIDDVSLLVVQIQLLIHILLHRLAHIGIGSALHLICQELDQLPRYADLEVVDVDQSHLRTVYLWGRLPLVADHCYVGAAAAVVAGFELLMLVILCDREVSALHRIVLPQVLLNHLVTLLKQHVDLHKLIVLRDNVVVFLDYLIGCKAMVPFLPNSQVFYYLKSNIGRNVREVSFVTHAQRRRRQPFPSPYFEIFVLVDEIPPTVDIGFDV